MKILPPAAFGCFLLLTLLVASAAPLQVQPSPDTVSTQTNELIATVVAAQLEGLREAIAADVAVELQRSNITASYTVVWRVYEDAAIAALEKVLPRHIPELGIQNFYSGKRGKEKNRLADFAIICGTNIIEISIKAARASANPENDMGTFRDHSRRSQLFAASFTLWVRYDDSMPEIRCDRVFFDRTWRMVGKSMLVDGVKYRKKDGNMRPKSWTMFESGAAFWETEGEFEAAVERAAVFRANEVVSERLADLSENDQRALYGRLKQKFSIEIPEKFSKEP